MFSSSGSQVSGASGAVFIEDVFSTTLFEGTNATQTIVNDIDLAGKGGMVWSATRSSASADGNGPEIIDTDRGGNKRLRTRSTASEFTLADPITFNSNGITMGPTVNSYINGNALKKVLWAFRKQPKFFDVVPVSRGGSSSSNARISHNLGSVPGFVIVKSTDNTGESWRCYHRSLGINQVVQLNVTSGIVNLTNYWGTANPTSTDFGINWNYFSGSEYVFYFFAHDAGGFGLTGTDSVISCGVFNTPGSGDLEINLGWQPQWLMVKQVDSTAQGFYDNWSIIDTMRGMAVESSKNIYANAPAGGLDVDEQNWTSYDSGILTPNGFIINPSANPTIASGQRAIYIAIRRPMKVPTDATKVFSASLSSATTGILNSGFVTDLAFTLDRTAGGGSGYGRNIYSRMHGNFKSLNTPGNTAEIVNSSTVSFDQQNGIKLNGGTVYSTGYVYEQFKRAPGFLDVVYWKGAGTTQALPHGLGVGPELAIVKRINGVSNFLVMAKINSTQLNVGPSSGDELRLNSDQGIGTTYYTYADYVNSTTFSTNTFWNTPNVDGAKYIAFLFATCPGVSKVGSYIGNGASQNIDCGFASGARFIMIKRTDSANDWHIFDTARGIVAGNDPYLKLNTNGGEDTVQDIIDTYSAGFAVNAFNGVNAIGGTFIFLAIA
jgi:hypothetical protein